jgi:hypothetical protein
MRRASLVVAVCLIAAACSENDTTDTSDAADGATVTSSVPVTTPTTTTLRPPAPTDPPPPDAPTIGELEIPCSPVDLVPVEGRAGVSDDAIIIGTGTDRGGIGTPGAGRGVIDMIEALADHCNAHGGLLGRDVLVQDYDAAAVEAGERIAEACDEVAAMVGHVFVQLLEAGFAAAACELPLFPAGADLLPTSPVTIQGNVVALLADPASAATVVLVGPDTLSAATDRGTRRTAIELVGGSLSVVGDLGYPVDRVPDWIRIVGEARATGAGQVHLSGGCAQAVVPFVEVAAAAGWEPVVVTTAAAYDDECLAIETPDRLFIELPFLPFEDGASAPSTTAHAELLDRIAAPRTGNGILAASAFWRWATAAPTCLSSVESACFSTFASQLGGWTAGGLHPAIGVDGTTEGCAVVMGVADGGFVRRLPVEPGTYDCTPEWSAALG